VYRDQKVVVVMPAYNSARMLRRTYDEVMALVVLRLAGNPRTLECIQDRSRAA
jgi:hypothetical protein